MATNLLRGSYSALKGLATGRVEFSCERIPHRFDKVPLKKILNWIGVEASVRLRAPKPWGMPTILHIEPTNRCNLRCSLCPVAEGLTREAGFMEMELFRRIIDEACDHVLLVLLWGWGEPFIHPDIHKMTEYATSKGVRLVSSSNGHVFASGDHAEKVVRSGLDSLIVGIDGISQETYSRFRRDGKLETVLEGIRAMVSKKRELKAQTPFINLRFIVMKHNEHEIPQLHNLAKSLGVDSLTLKTLNPGYGADPAQDRENEFIPRNPAYRRFQYTGDFMRIRRVKNQCPNLWRSPTIHWNGKVYPCSCDVEEHHPLGDFEKMTLKDIWLGDAYTAMRHRFRENWESIHECRNCSYAYRGGDCSRDTIVESVFFNS